MRIRHPSLAFVLALAWSSVGLAQGVSTPSVSSRPGTGMTAGQAPAAEEPAPPAAGSGGRAAPSTPATGATPGAVSTTAPAMSGEPRRPSALSMPVDPRGGSWEGTAPPTATLDSVVNSGAPMGGSKVPRKVCPPGLFNRDGNCVAPAGGIMR